MAVKKPKFLLVLLMVSLALRSEAAGAEPPFVPTAEYNAQSGLAVIQADGAYREGLSGKGVTVGVLDSGINPQHVEFKDQTNRTVTGYDFISDSPVLIDGDAGGHGSHVAGILGAAKNDIGMHGVAYNSNLVIARHIGATTMDEWFNALSRSVDYTVARGATILNNSYAMYQDVTSVDRAFLEENLQKPLSSYRKAVEKKTLLVFGAGNSSFPNPDIFAALPYHFPELQPYWLSVIAVYNNEKTDYSNAAGVAKAWTIAAPGGTAEKVNGELIHGIYSVKASTNDSYFRDSGTSMAAPHVSGAAALLKEKYPTYTGDKIAQLLLWTATDLGAPGVDDIYGWGLLNVAAAVKGPVLETSKEVILPADTNFRFDLDLTGAGGLTKSGAGTLVLGGNNAYTGGTVAAGGVLQIDGSVAGDAWSEKPGTIAGSGTITGNLTNNSIVQAGSYDITKLSRPFSPGTLHVGGDLYSTGKIAVASASPSNYGKISVTGSAALNGTTFTTVPGSIYQSTTYKDVVTTTTGTITGVSASFAPLTLFFSAKGTVSDNKKALDMELMSANNFISTRQQQTYRSLEGLYDQKSLNYFASLDAAQANGVLTSIYGGAQLNQAAIIQSDNTFSQAVAARLSYLTQTKGKTMSFTLPTFAPGSYTVNAIIPLELDSRNSWWMKAAKGWGSTSGRDGLPSLDNQHFGIVVGQDKKAGDHWRTGILIGYSQNTVTSSLSNTSSHGYRVGLYGGYQKEAFSLRTHLDYGRQGNNATRTLQDLLLQNLKAGSSYDSNTLSFGLSASYNLHHNADKLWQISPYADIQISRYNQDGYRESGAGSLSQLADPFANTYSTGEIGLEMARQIPKGRYAFRVGYKRVLGGADPDMTIAYSGAAGSRLTIRGCEQDRQQLTFGLIIQGEMAKDWTIDSQINHQQGSASRSLTAAVTLRKVW